MTIINFSLICKKNPHVVSTEDIDSISSINLSNCGIKEIDNLDVFSHISELDLSRNEIEIIENLELFDKLQLLDLSFNKITSKNLRQSFKRIPKSLIQINLAGNECVEDVEVLGDLQDLFPDLIIAIEFEDEIIEEKKDERKFKSKLSQEYKAEFGEAKAQDEDAEVDVDEENGDEEEEDDEEEEEEDELDEEELLSFGLKSLNFNNVVNNEAILKDIVDRKCRIQALSTFNLDQSIAELNFEMNKSLERYKNKDNLLEKEEETKDIGGKLSRNNSKRKIINIDEKNDNELDEDEKEDTILKKILNENKKFEDIQKKIKNEVIRIENNHKKDILLYDDILNKIKKESKDRINKIKNNFYTTTTNNNNNNNSN